MTILLTNMLMVDVDGQKFVWKILYLLYVSPRSQMREREVKGHSDKASGKNPILITADFGQTSKNLSVPQLFLFECQNKLV